MGMYVLCVQFPAGAKTGLFLFATASILALGSTQPAFEWVLWLK